MVIDKVNDALERGEVLGARGAGETELSQQLMKLL